MPGLAEHCVSAPTTTWTTRPRARMLALRSLRFLAPLTLLTGCTIGPDFTQPTPPDVESLTPRPLKDQVAAGGKVQRFAHGLDIPGSWWTLFQSRQLSNLMERALRDNHDLKAAQAALRGARANYEAQRGAFFPTVNGNYAPSRQKVATGDFGAPTLSGDPIYSVHTAQLTVAYVPDVFGATRRQVENSAAQAQAQRFMLEATYLTLTSSIALAAIQEASLHHQIGVTQRAIADENLLLTVQQRTKLDPSQLDEASLKMGIAQAEQTIPQLRKQLAIQRDLLTALSGRLASEGLPEHFDFGEMRLPQDLPVSLPSQLVEQRPDVRAAEANLHAATAAVGVAMANRLPLFNLTGNIGRTSTQFKNLFNPEPQYLFWTIAGSVTQTIFDGFSLEQKQRAAEAGWDQAAEQYKSTVVTAFQNVADVLQAIELDAQALHYALAAERAAARNLCLTVASFVKFDGRKLIDPILAASPEFVTRFEGWWKPNCAKERFVWKSAAGDTGLFAEDKKGSDVLTVEQLYLAARLNVVQARAARYADTVALFQALGGGWWNRSDVETREARGWLAHPAPTLRDR